MKYRGFTFKGSGAQRKALGERKLIVFIDAYRLQIHSTNPLERLNAEIRRRTDVVGIFPNDPPIVRLVGAMMLEQNDEWLLNRRYMQLEGLQSLSDNPQTRPSGVTRSVPASQPLLAGNYTISRDTIGD